MLHEIGHSTAVRILGEKRTVWSGEGINSKRGEVEIPPDSKIPEKDRSAFLEAARKINAASLVVDYVYGRELRLNYTSEIIERIADLHVMYFYNGQAIREYVNSADQTSEDVKAWQTVYEFLKKYVFGGREYKI